MTDKTKKIIIRTVAAVVITPNYFYAACIAGNIITVISLSFSVMITDEMNTLTKVLIFVPSVLFFTFMDNLLFDPLCKLFGHSALVYAVLSGNFITLRGIFVIIEGSSSSGTLSFFSWLGAMVFVTPVTSLFGGVLFCFLIRLFRKNKPKETVVGEGEKEYIEWKKS